MARGTSVPQNPGLGNTSQSCLHGPHGSATSSLCCLQRHGTFLPPHALANAVPAAKMPSLFPALSPCSVHLKSDRSTEAPTGPPGGLHRLPLYLLKEMAADACYFFVSAV